jgi:dihydroneopterin aldolase/D-erythro-7,8-dihydroneopterin triphosphate epimerase
MATEPIAPDGVSPDRIHIQDLLARCIVGLNPDEREAPQDVLINLTLWADLREAGRTDDLAHTVDYSALKKRILAMVEASSDLLIERLAQRVADLCLADAHVDRVSVRIDKPGALRFARSVAVEIHRRRDRAEAGAPRPTSGDPTGDVDEA